MTSGAGNKATQPGMGAGQATPIACTADRGFRAWLAQSGGTLAVSTYQAGRLLLAGWNGRQVTLLMRAFDRAMGLDSDGDRLALATRYAVHLFQNNRVLAHHYDAERPGRYDSLYLPRSTHHVGDLNIHDIAIGTNTIWLVNTRFSCLAKLSATFSFEPAWQPPFISELTPEDRCHLNGLALLDGEPAYVTALGETDNPAGWREHKANHGIVMDVSNNEVLLGGLAMPHSPRWHDGMLWVLDSGTGQLLRISPDTGACDVICRLQGYLRGLTFVGRHALVGLCQIRETNVFGGMPVQTHHDKLLCGVALVDIDTGEQEGLFEFTAGCTEIYDIRFIHGIQRPNILNLEKPETSKAVTSPDFHFWLTPDKRS